MTQKIAITSSMNLEPFIEVCEEYKVPWRTIADKHGLPMDDAAGNQWLPTQFAMRFVHDLAMQTGEPVGRLAGERFDLAKLDHPAAEVMAQAEGLEQAYEVVMTYFRDFNNHVLLWPERIEGQWMLCHRCLFPPTLPGSSQVEWFRVMLMMGLFRPFLPKDWKPEVLWLYTPSPKSALPQALASTQMRYNAPYGAIPLPFADDFQPFAQPSQSTAWLDSLLALASTYAVLPEFNIHWLARLTNTSPRTLQRRLKDHGVQFRQMRDEARYLQARKLLESTEMTVEEIAWRTGYSDRANFNRAFRAWSGVTAPQFRRQLSEPG
ncbi:helix-turn-helix domain-containing protein [Ferrimonas marina]|uniref:AraC-type DNA-binding protein n=1 Tax=Ferrimonas marina TaxID=299255 RepID=A0A1M5P687_9GAMM|nr:AraC family transcriptional regulator [Ferrimonas marina]SHG97235.1 AraC-type DNA-binding protein [Ferrimonas marina]